MPKIEEVVDWSADQLRAIDMVKSGRSVCITGSAGVGKSKLVEELRNELSLQGKRVAICGTTGVSAVNVNGQTVHKWAGIRLGTGTKEALLKMVRGNRQAMKNWRQADALIIDEVSMLLPDLYDKLDYIGQHIRGNTAPFGGLQLILVGDFFQLPPVQPNRVPGTPIFCFQTETWKHTIGSNVIELRKVFRQTDALWIRVLNKIREGEVDAEVTQTLQSRLNATLHLPKDIKPTELRPNNAAVDAINTSELAKLPGESVTFEATFAVPGRSFGLEIIKKQMVDSVRVPERLELKVGAQVVLKANIDVAGGLANGSRGVVTGFVGEKRLPKVRFVCGRKVVVALNEWKWKNKVEKYQAIYTQIPLRLAWAITVHSSQGLSLDAAKMDLGPSIFEPGQSYTALSRMRSLEGLCITQLDLDRINAYYVVSEFFKELREAQAAAAPKRSLDAYVQQSKPKRQKQETLPSLAEFPIRDPPKELWVFWDRYGVAQVVSRDNKEALNLFSEGVPGARYRITEYFE